MDPFKMMHLKPALEQFAERHPRFVQFLGFASGALQEGSLLEISIKDPEGKAPVYNEVTQQLQQRGFVYSNVRLRNEIREHVQIEEDGAV